MPAEQKGCKNSSYGCKDQLFINKMILEECQNKRKNLSTAWIGYRKAFDSIPHSWIIKALQMYKVSPVLVSYIRHSMNTWQTTMILNYSSGSIEATPIRIIRGIFQEDSLPPLLFCLSLAPLRNLLKATDLGYEMKKERFYHLLYMDDLKLYAKNDKQLERLLTIVKKFSDNIQMQFGLDKCAKASFKKGKLTKTTHIEQDDKSIIQELDPDGAYKYLGIFESNDIKHATMKEKVRKEYYRRVKMVLKSELNSSNKVSAITALVIPVVAYSINIINWQMKEIKKMDAKTRKLFTMHKMHHPKADEDRMYLPRKEGGRGLIQLECTYKTNNMTLVRNYIRFIKKLLNLQKNCSCRRMMLRYKKLYQLQK